MKCKCTRHSLAYPKSNYLNLSQFRCESNDEKWTWIAIVTNVFGWDYSKEEYQNSCENKLFEITGDHVLSLSPSLFLFILGVFHWELNPCSVKFLTSLLPIQPMFVFCNCEYIQNFDRIVIRNIAEYTDWLDTDLFCIQNSFDFIAIMVRKKSIIIFFYFQKNNIVY